jgi:hypothetical protein
VEEEISWAPDIPCLLVKACLVPIVALACALDLIQWDHLVDHKILFAISSSSHLAVGVHLEVSVIPIQIMLVHPTI